MNDLNGIDELLEKWENQGRKISSVYRKNNGISVNIEKLDEEGKYTPYAALFRHRKIWYSLTKQNDELKFTELSQIAGLAYEAFYQEFIKEIS